MKEGIANQSPATGQFSIRLSPRLKNASLVIIAVILLLSILDLIGWIAGVEWLKSLGQYWIEMRPVAAISFVLISASLTIILTGRPAAIRTYFPVATVILLALVSSFTIFTWIYADFNEKETALTILPVFNLFLSPEARMPFLSSIIFLVTCITLILILSEKPVAADIAHILCFPVAFVSYMITGAYILKVPFIYHFLGGPVALNSGIAYGAICIVIYLIRPDTWLMKVFASKLLGGLMARRLLPWLLLLPIFIGWLRIAGEHAGLFVSEVGVLMVALTYASGFIFLIWFTAKSINIIDRRRQLSDETLINSNEELEKRVSERTSELLELNIALDKEIKIRRKAEELVQAERQRFDNLLEIMPAYLILLTPDHHVSYSNRFFRERFGESRGRPCYEFLFNRTEPCEVCETYRVLRENKPITWEWTGPDRNIYSIFDFPYTDSDGSPLIMEMGIDVTSLKKAEANLVALNAELEQRITERTTELLMANARLDILSETSGRLLESENPLELINSLCIRVMKFLDCHIFFNFLTENKGKLHLNSYAGVPEKTAAEFEWLDYGTSVCGCVARDGIRIVAENIQETYDPRTNFVKSLGIKAYACHPLLSHEKVMGTLSFGTDKRKSFSEDDLALMKTVTDQVAIALTRERDEGSLRRSEERYRKLLESSPNACLVNRDDKIELLNSAAQKLLGIESVGEVIGTSPLRFFHPDYHSKIRERMSRLISGETLPVMEEKIVRTNGEIRDVEVVSTGLVDSEGSAYQVIMTDITQRKLAEKELFDAKNYLQNLINYANAPIIVWDQENKIRLFNHAFEHLTGYNSSEVEGKKLDLLFPKRTLKESMGKIRQALTENWVTIEIPILTKNKEIRTVLWNSAMIFDEAGNAISTIAQGNDITERIAAEQAFKNSKEKLEIALENGNIGIWEWDLATNQFLPDARMVRMLGRGNGTFRNTYNDFEQSIHEEDRLHVRNAMRKALEEGSPFETIFRIKHKNNDINYISTKALVDKDREGNPVKMSGVCFDITDMKMGAEKAMFSLNEELLRSNKELEQFAYVASHDLQEPLRMISSFTQLLSQRYGDRLDNDAKEFIQYAVEGAARMQALINDLLEYSRIQTRGRKFSKVDIQSIIGLVVNNLRLKIQEVSALVTNDELPEVNADEGQMVQLFQNLLENGLKFCKTTPLIHISAIEEEDHFLFSVRDNGIGIEASYFDRIFQIFQRLHPKDKYGGTGIGLAICKRIIDRHGGKIWVESKPGKGSVFYFTILKSHIIPEYEKSIR